MAVSEVARADSNGQRLVSSIWTINNEGGELKWSQLIREAVGESLALRET